MFWARWREKWMRLRRLRHWSTTGVPSELAELLFQLKNHCVFQRTKKEHCSHAMEKHHLGSNYEIWRLPRPFFSGFYFHTAGESTKIKLLWWKNPCLHQQECFWKGCVQIGGWFLQASLLRLCTSSCDRRWCHMKLLLLCFRPKARSKNVWFAATDVNPPRPVESPDEFLSQKLQEREKDLETAHRELVARQTQRTFGRFLLGSSKALARGEVHELRRFWRKTVHFHFFLECQFRMWLPGYMQYILWWCPRNSCFWCFLWFPGR